MVFAFKQVAAVSANATQKVDKIASLIERLGQISAASRHISPFNGLTPVLSCLDPQRRFPIMNERTRKRLSFIGMNPGRDGLVALSKLIGRVHGVKNAFELDA